MNRRYTLLVALLSLVLLLSACASPTADANTTATAEPTTSAAPAEPTQDEQEAAAEDTSAYPVTIVNYAKVEGGTEWSKKETVYEKAPERIVATTRTAAEFLMHIGLGDKIVGVGGVFGAPDQELEEEFVKLTVLSESYIGRETALSADPDFIFGRGGLFDNADWGVGTVDSLNDMGINTFVMESSITGGDISSIYQDIENLGKIFDVQEQANAFADTLRQKEALVVNALSAIDQEHTFGYIHSSDPENFLIYSASEESFFNSAFALLKMQNSFLGVSGDISIEALIEADPDYLIAMHWETDDNNNPKAVEDTINEVLNNPKLSSLKAVQNKAVYVANYNHLFGYSYQTLDGLEIMARQIYPEMFQ